MTRAGAGSAAAGQARGSAARQAGGPAAGYDMVVWAEIAAEPAEIPGIAVPYQASGATWWIETAKPEPRWWEGVQERVARGVPL